MTLARAQTVVVWLAVASATMAGLQKPTAAVDPSPVGDVVTPDGIRLHYEINGKGTTIVVLHGGPGLSSAYLTPNLDVLTGHYRLISYDQRGAGRSTVVTDPAKLSRDHNVEDIEAVRHQFGLEKVVLLEDRRAPANGRTAQTGRTPRSLDSKKLSGAVTIG